MNAKNLSRALLCALCLLGLSAASHAGNFSVGLTVAIAPPMLPVYVQPPCPAPDYLWTPGYWAYDGDDGYYWIPGTWVVAPAAGLFWTPGYWAAVDEFYSWHPGYWAPHVGFYGGINYGFGFFGIGFAGGYWHDHEFFYNRAVANVTNVNVTNVYNTTIVNNQVNHVSYNGGGGVQARPSGAELAVARQPHYGATPVQRSHAEAARAVPSLLASVNKGRPPIAATARPAVFEGHDVVPARHASIVQVPPVHRSADNRARATPSLAADAHTASTVGGFRGQNSKPAPETPRLSDRPAWASRGRPGPALSNVSAVAPSVRPAAHSEFERPALTYRNTTGAAPRPVPSSRPETRGPTVASAAPHPYANHWTPPQSYRPAPESVRAPSSPPTRPYATQPPAQHWSEPRAPQRSDPPSHGNAATIRSTPPAHMSAPEPHDGRHA
jgi:YXWGXW repeat-containing protein